MNKACFWSLVFVFAIPLAGCMGPDNDGEDGYSVLNQALISTQANATRRIASSGGILHGAAVTVVTQGVYSTSVSVGRSSLSDQHGNFCEEENPELTERQRFSHSICSGTIIGKNLVMTAAHCLHGHLNPYVIRGYRMGPVISDTVAIDQRVQASVFYSDSQKDVAILYVPGLKGAKAPLYCGTLNPGFYSGAFEGNSEGLPLLYRSGRVFVSGVAIAQMDGFKGDSGSGLLLSNPRINGASHTPAVVGLAKTISNYNCSVEAPPFIENYKAFDSTYGRGTTTDGRTCTFWLRASTSQDACGVSFILWEDFREDVCRSHKRHGHPAARAIESICCGIQPDPDPNQPNNNNGFGNNGQWLPPDSTSPSDVQFDPESSDGNDSDDSGGSTGDGDFDPPAFTCQPSCAPHVILTPGQPYTCWGVTRVCTQYGMQIQ